MSCQYTHTHTHTEAKFTGNTCIYRIHSEGGWNPEKGTAQERGGCSREAVASLTSGRAARGLIGIHSPSKDLRICALRAQAVADLRPRSDPDILEELQCLRRRFLTLLHGDADPHKTTLRFSEHFSSCSCLCGSVLFLCYAALAILDGGTFDMIRGDIIAAGPCTHKWGAWPKWRRSEKQIKLSATLLKHQLI